MNDYAKLIQSIPKILAYENIELFYERLKQEGYDFGRLKSQGLSLEDLRQIAVARYLYIELGKYFIYDPEIIEAQDIETRKKIAFRSIEEITNNRVVCISLSKIYTKILNDCNIGAKTIPIPPDPNVPNDIGHAFTQISIGGRVRPVGLIKDLTNIKVGFKTAEFLPRIPKLSEMTEEDRKKAEERIRKIKEERKKAGEGEKSEEDLDDLILSLDEETLRTIDGIIGYTHNRPIFE